jgi:hypothetical protein
MAAVTVTAGGSSAAWRAGVLRYVADFGAREVTCYGWNGDSYLGSCPDAATGQPWPLAGVFSGRRPGRAAARRR